MRDLLDWVYIYTNIPTVIDFQEEKRNQNIDREIKIRSEMYEVLH